jgi:hypothetical protein
MHGRLRPLQAAMDSSTARLLVAVSSLALLVSTGTSPALAATLGEEQVSAADSCSAVTFSYSQFPVAPITAREVVSVDGQHIAEAQFAFDGPEGSSTVAVHIPPGRHSMDAKASWDVGGRHGGRDMKLAGGITCGAEPGLTLEARQRVSGGSEPFTAGTVSGFPGELVDYQITAANTGNVGLTLTSFADPHCDAGTLGGGPAGPVAPGASVTYSCEHALTAADRTAGEYTNTATAAGTWSEGGSGELTRTSNTVLTYVTDPPPPPPPPPPAAGPPQGGVKGSSPGGTGGGALSFGQSAGASHCALSLVRTSLSVDGKGRASLRLAVTGAGTCRGRLALAVKRKTRQGKTKMQTLASRTFSLPAGRSAVLTLSLNKLGRALLHAGHGRLSASLTVLKLSPAPASAHTARVRLSVVHSRAAKH